MRIKSRRALLLSSLLLLVATHVAVFLLARGITAQPDDAEEVRDPSYIPPAKSADRDNPSIDSGGGSFNRRLRELEASNLPRHDFELAREALIREWIRRDLRGAMDLLYKPEQRKRYQDLAETLEAELTAEIARQPRAVWDWIATRRYGSSGPRVFGLWCETLARAGQTDVLLECLGQPGAPAFMDDDAVDLLCAKIPAGAAAQLAALRKWIVPPGNSEIEGPAATYAWRMAAEAGADPVPFLTAEPDEMMRSIFLEKWERRELGDLPVAEQVQRIAALPQEFHAAAADAMVHHERGDTVAAVDLINALDAARLMGDPSGDTARDLAKSALNWVMEDELTTGLGSVRALQAIRADPLRRQALKNFGSLYDHRAPSPVLESMEVIPEGPDRDAFISGVVRFAEMTEETRGQMLDAIQDPQLAAEARREVAEMLEKQKKEAERERARAEEGEGGETEGGGFVLPGE